MGLYVEPAGDKDIWIKEHGTETSIVANAAIAWASVPSDRMLVALMYQGFISLGCAYRKSELQRFITGRPDAIWYLVPKAVLREVVPGAKKMKEFE